MAKKGSRTNKITDGKPLKVITSPIVMDNMGGIPVKVNSIKSAKRLLSRLIYDLQKGLIANQQAKDLTYMLQVYVNLCAQERDILYDKRIAALEKALEQAKNNEDGAPKSLKIEFQ